MSSVYVTEPPTRGKVLLRTSCGDVDIELWSKEAPKACRNFVQLCLDGYYNDCIFHRIIKGLFAQTGDPTGTGHGGESIYGSFFPDELHSRLKFSHRGQVACANLNVPNSNTSQFFVTFDKCPWLDKRHTIFGKVTGNTIFNVLRLGEVDVDKDDRPHEPPRVLSAEVLENPFEDMVARCVPGPAIHSRGRGWDALVIAVAPLVPPYALLLLQEEARNRGCRLWQRPAPRSRHRHRTWPLDGPYGAAPVVVCGR